MTPASPPPLFSKDLLQNFFSYLFHEIISPVSSLLTGIELLEDDATYSEELVSILKSASQSLRARLEYFRAALGAGGTTLSPAQVQKFITKLWEAESVPPVSFQTKAEFFSPGIGQQALLLTLWLSQKKTFRAEPGILFYEAGEFFAQLGGEKLSFVDIKRELTLSEDSCGPKEDASLFLEKILELDDTPLGSS